jgi:hypothetical protein
MAYGIKDKKMNTLSFSCSLRSLQILGKFYKFGSVSQSISMHLVTFLEPMMKIFRVHRGEGSKEWNPCRTCYSPISGLLCRLP